MQPSNLKQRSVMLCLGLLAFFAQVGQATDALHFFKNYFVTGDYVVGGVGLRGKGVGGWAAGNINITGVPAGADIVATFLYWQTIEKASDAPLVNGYFDGKPIVGLKLTDDHTPACWSISANPTIRTYRADVLRYLAIDTTKNVRIANGPHTVKLRDNGNLLLGTPMTDGASLVVIYRVLTPGTPLKSVVIYDGEFALGHGWSVMNQTISGFYQASGGSAKMTHIAGEGQLLRLETLRVNGAIPAGVSSTNPFQSAQGYAWDNLTFNFPIAANASSVQTQVTPGLLFDCLTWAAIITSTTVTDTDGDGLLDIWETTSGLTDPTGQALPDLPAMGANPNVPDIFVEIDWLQGSDHVHAPKPDALNAVGATFLNHGIRMHFDVGPSYTGSTYTVPAAYAQGGEVVPESSLVCPMGAWTHCAFPGLPYPVLGWKVGLHAVKDGFPAFGLPAHFSHPRKDIFHYVVFAHALGVPVTPQPPSGPTPKSISGVADRPGGDLMITLGLWRSDIVENDQVGSSLVQAGTLMHEMGHNLGLLHAGLYRTPNCMANYQSVMNYLYQTRGLTDGGGDEHIDYSSGALNALNETTLSETAPLSGGPLQYRVRYYAPLGSDPPGSAAKVHCDGTPITDGALMTRVENSFPDFIDWNHDNAKAAPGSFVSLDVNFSGQVGDGVDAAHGVYFVDSNDWANLNLRQIGARVNVGGLSGDVGQTELGLGDPGQTELGQTELGQTELGQTELGQTELGQTELGQTELGDEDYQTHVLSQTDPLPGPSPSCPQCGLHAESKSDRITLTWTPPPTGHVDSYNVYRSISGGPTGPAFTSVGGSTLTFDDLIGSNTFINTTYTYYVSAVVSVAGVASESPRSNPASGAVVKPNDKTRTYGASNPPFDFTPALDAALSAAVTCSTTAVATSDVGSYPITCSGAPAGVSVFYLPGTLTITKAIATFVITPYHVFYDHNPHTATGTATGVLSENLSASLNLTGTTHTNAGDYPSDAWTFAGGINYFDGNGTVHDIIDRVPLAVKADNQVKVYGAPLPAFTVSYTGFVGGETPSVLGGVLSCTTTATATSPVSGSPYPINCSGQTSTNYNIAYAPGSLTVTKATPVFSNLSSPVIKEHTASTTISGKISYSPPGGSPVYPTGTVSIVLKGVTKTPTIAANGTFSAVFSTGGIEDGTYTITFKYTSTDPNFNSAPNATSTLKITEH